mgnify:CR=1 FL=1
MIDLDKIIIDRTPRETLIHIEKLRTELKGLGYSVVDTRYLAGLLIVAERRKALEATS